MTHDQREIHRKKRILEYAERVGNINKTCRYFGVARSTLIARSVLVRARRVHRNVIWHAGSRVDGATDAG
jgi:hypothetical protein